MPCMTPGHSSCRLLCTAALCVLSSLRLGSSVEYVASACSVVPSCTVYFICSVPCLARICVVCPCKPCAIALHQIPCIESWRWAKIYLLWLGFVFTFMAIFVHYRTHRDAVYRAIHMNRSGFWLQYDALKLVNQTLMESLDCRGLEGKQCGAPAHALLLLASARAPSPQ